MPINKKRVSAAILEQVITYLIVLFAFVAIALFFSSFNPAVNPANLAILLMLIVVILCILAQTVLMIRIYAKRLKS